MNSFFENKQMTRESFISNDVNTLCSIERFYYSKNCYCLDLVPLILSLVIMTLICGCEGCDYAHVDPMHTMCVFAPRMCSQRKLLRE